MAPGDGSRCPSPARCGRTIAAAWHVSNRFHTVELFPSIGAPHLRVDPHGGQSGCQLGMKGVVVEVVAGFEVAILLVARGGRRRLTPAGNGEL